MTISKRMLLAMSLGLATSAGAAPKDRDPTPAQTAQTNADRYFKSGVALFKEGKFAEALAEFQRAYEIAPHPTVLYNIAGCHRELSHYAEAVKYYERFLTEGKGKVPASRLTTAQTELDGILARIARVTVTIAPEDGATLLLDGQPLGTLLEMPLILPPGEHKFTARSAGHADAERTLRLASGDEVSIELAMPELPPEVVVAPVPSERLVVITHPPRRFQLGAGFGTNLRRISDSGAPSIGASISLGTRIELGVDAVLVAYAAIPSIRIKLAGNALAIHAVVAVPIAFADDGMTTTFAAGAVGLGLRYRPVPALAFRLETFASYAGKAHGTTVPTFLGGELWF